MHHRHAPFAIVAALLLVCALLAWSYFTGPGRPRTFPAGQQTLTGTLIPAELSLSRRGTHILKIEGDDIAYVESATVNLRLYELTNVGITGTFYSNTDPSDLPVLIAEAVHPIEIPTVTVDVPNLGLTLRVPPSWHQVMFDDGIAFSLSEADPPLLRVMRSSLTRLPAGTPLLIGGYDAVRALGPRDSQIVYLHGGRTIVTFTWEPTTEDQTAIFAQILRTAQLHAPSTSSAATSSMRGTSSAASSIKALPCGGPAGVLCPPGSFCSVNAPDGVGVCVPLR